MLTYTITCDRELLNLVADLHRAASVLARLEAGEPPHLLGVKPATAAISAAICMITNYRLALHQTQTTKAGGMNDRRNHKPH
jgi:hypothetical protein